MSDGRQHLRICRLCGQEKSRTVSGGTYHYYCHCAIWKQHMAVLEYARRQEEARRPRRSRAAAALNGRPFVVQASAAS